ncbi:MAG TPA: hypothetical protein PK264_05510 [Hyphomicrobiaceae bacterium]|nr:hypothetical protein [Hyphomicrobiaceae bacterium]
MRATVAEADQMTIEEFLAFTTERPHDERWELVDGVPILNVSPTDVHQIIVFDTLIALSELRRETGAAADVWCRHAGSAVATQPAETRRRREAAVGVGAPGHGRGAGPIRGAVAQQHAVRSGLASQGFGEQSVPRHYVTVSQRKVDVVRHDLASGWQATRLTALDAQIELAALGGSINLADLFVTLRSARLRRPE